MIYKPTVGGGLCDNNVNRDNLHEIKPIETLIRKFGNSVIEHCIVTIGRKGIRNKQNFFIADDCT